MKSPALWFTLSLLMVVGACASPRLLAPAPSLYSEQTPYPKQRVAPAERSSSAELIYVTDRKYSSEEEKYGSIRSAAVHVGTVKIDVGNGLDWERLVERSHMDASDEKQPKLGPARVSRMIEFPETPIPFAFENGEFTEREDLRTAYNQSILEFQSMIEERLRSAETNSVLVYVHGFNNSFENAAHTLTDLWHYSGRSSVPVMFSWPASEGNMLGYFADRESGEFSIFHLKEMFRALRDMEGVEKIHVIAHSRGTDVTTTALRELVIETRASGRSAREALKIENLVLAAPDLDLEVVKQRLIAERFGPAIGQITIYSNPGDAALGLSSFITEGIRFGRVTSEDLGERVTEVFRGVRNVHFVNASHVPGLVGHSYFRTHPGIFADISVLIQTSAKPESAERPLIPISGNFYRLEDNYKASLPPSSDD